MTKYTEQEKQNLSRKVAEKYGIEASKEVVMSIGLGSGIELQDLWLHDDWQTLCEECNKRGIWVRRFEDCFIAYSFKSPAIICRVDIDDCQSESEAERIARLMALGEL